MGDKKLPKCEKSIYLWFVQVFIVLGLTSLIIWWTLIPKTPIVSFSADKNDAVLSRNSSSFVFNLSISNPNKRFDVLLDDMNITLRCGNDVVGSKSIHGLYVGQKKSGSEEVELGVGDYYKLCKGITDMRVVVEMMVRYWNLILRYKTKRHLFVFEDYVHLAPHTK